MQVRERDPNQYLQVRFRITCVTLAPRRSGGRLDCGTGPLVVSYQFKRCFDDLESVIAQQQCSHFPVSRDVNMWWRRLPHLLGGLALITGSIYFFGGMVAGWRLTRQWPIVSGRTNSVKPQVENDEIPGDEKPKTLGVLPTLLGNQNEKDEETEVASTSGPLLGVDRISSSKALAPHRFLHRRISVKAYEGFGFEVPAHATRPRIHGEFNSFVVDGSSGELHEENVEVLLLSEEEYRDFVHGRAGAASFGRPPSAGAVIDWTLDATLFQPLKYYLVFRNSSPERQTELVDADFSLSFD